MRTVLITVTCLGRRYQFVDCFATSGEALVAYMARYPAAESIQAKTITLH